MNDDLPYLRELLIADKVLIKAEFLYRPKDEKLLVNFQIHVGIFEYLEYFMVIH